MLFVATINTPGFLPDSAEPAPLFDSARDAWSFLKDELDRADMAYEPSHERGYDPDGPQQLTESALAMEARADGAALFGTVHDCEGTAYSVDQYDGACEWFALCENTANQLVAHPILNDVPACDRCAARAR